MTLHTLISYTLSYLFLWFLLPVSLFRGVPSPSALPSRDSLFFSLSRFSLGELIHIQFSMTSLSCCWFPKIHLQLRSPTSELHTQGSNCYWTSSPGIHKRYFQLIRSKMKLSDFLRPVSLLKFVTRLSRYSPELDTINSFFRTLIHLFPLTSTPKHVRSTAVLLSQRLSWNHYKSPLSRLLTPIFPLPCFKKYSYTNIWYGCTGLRSGLHLSIQRLPQVNPLLLKPKKE